MRSYNITSAGASAAEDRDRRIKVYFIMMSIRVACIVSLIWVRGWWILVAAIGGILLPYFAVVLANEPKQQNKQQAQTLEKRAITTLEPKQDAPLIVVDDPAPRRAADFNPDEAAPEATKDTEEKTD